MQVGWKYFYVLKGRFYSFADFVRDPERFLTTSVGEQRGLFSEADSMSANQWVDEAFHVLKIFGGFRRKRYVNSFFASFASFAAYNSSADFIRDPEWGIASSQYARGALDKAASSRRTPRNCHAHYKRRSLNPYQFMNLNGKTEAGVLFDEGDRFVEIVFPATFNRLNKRHDSVTIK